MTCDKCKYAHELGNTDVTGMYICAFNEQFEMADLSVIDEKGCPFQVRPRAKVCKNCSHFGVDFACATQKEDSSFAEICGAYEDKEMEDLTWLLAKLVMECGYSKEELSEIVKEEINKFHFIEAE